MKWNVSRGSLEIAHTDLLLLLQFSGVCEVGSAAVCPHLVIGNLVLIVKVEDVRKLLIPRLPRSIAFEPDESRFAFTADFPCFGVENPLPEAHVLVSDVFLKKPEVSFDGGGAFGASELATEEGGKQWQAVLSSTDGMGRREVGKDLVDGSL